MIKNFNEDIDLIEYLDGNRIPPYCIFIPETEALYDILMEMYEQNSYHNIVGYLKDNKFSYYDLSQTEPYIDFTKDNLIIFVPNANINNLVEQHVIFNFISSPSKIIWFITKENLIRIEKTKAAYKLCEKINKIFDDFTYMRIFMDLVVSDNRQNTMNNLMDIMYVFNLIEPEKRILDWEYHYEYILEKCFKLNFIKV